MNAPEHRATGNAVAALNVNVPSLQMSEQELVKVLSSSLYPGAEIESIKLVIGWCKAQQKDPMKRPVHIVPMQVKQKKKTADGKPTNKSEFVWRDVLMPGIGDCRTDAARTGEYAGIGKATFGPDIDETLGGEPKKTWDDDAHAKIDSGQKYDTLQFRYPDWCEISVFRLVQGMRCEFSSGKVYFKETYATASNETSLPNAMWRKRPRGQLEKCAEAMALRRAFPEVGAEPTREEMEGKIIDGGDAVIEHGPAIEGPRAKSAGNQSAATHGGESSQAGPATTATRKDGPATAADTDAEGEKDERPMQDGQKRILRARLTHAGLTDIDLEAKFGKKIDSPGWLFSDFARIQAWVAERATGAPA